MLTVKTKLRLGPAGGLGVFTTALLRQGDVVWLYVPALSKPIELNDLGDLDDPGPQAALAALSAEAGWVDFEDPALWRVDIDNGRWIAHSDAPTLVTKGRMLVAAHDLPAGSELTRCYPYRLPEPRPRRPQPAEDMALHHSAPGA
jgi:hypothetical protein